MTRNEITAQFKVNALNGIIQDLGKFEGEMLYAPYFYNAVMHGDGERIGDADFFVLDDEDHKQFPELHDAYGVTLCESEQGFVYVRAHSREAFEQLKREQEQFEEANSDDAY